MQKIFNHIRKQNVDVITKFLENGGDVNFCDNDQRTLLINSVIEQSYDIAKLLINSGANIDAQDFGGWSALHFAVQNYDIDSVCLLIESGAKIDVKDSYGNTPLFRAIFSSKGRGEVIKILLKRGANPNSKNENGVSPYDLGACLSMPSI
jgi:ankyrin repeat protein